MSREVLNIGSAPNDGTGDTLRDGAVKINSNFQELYEGRMLRDFSNVASWDIPDGRYVMPGNIKGTENQVTVTLPGDRTVVLGTPQDIDQNADVTFRTLALALGLTLDDDNGYVQSETFVGDFGGSGVQLRKQNGKWRLTVDDVVVRNYMKIYELLVQQIQAGASFLLTEGHRVDQVNTIQGSSEVWSTSAEVWDTSAEVFGTAYECLIPEDMLLQLAVDDLVKRQEFTGRNVGVTNATVIDVEQGSATVTDNTPRRSFTIRIEDDGSAVPAEGFEFARIGNLSDPDRQGGIIMTSSDDGAPYERIFANVDSHAKFGQIETIMSQRGRLDNLVDPNFPTLDGTQQNLYGDYIDNIFARGRIILTGGEGISNFDDAGALVSANTLDDVPDGVNYTRTSTTAIDNNGLVIMAEIIGTADDVDEGTTNKFAAESGADVTSNNPQAQSWLTDSASIVNENDTITRLTGRVLSNIADDASYSKVNATAVSAGNILLSEAVGSVDDIGDGSTYGRVRQTSLSAGEILLSEAVGDLDDLSDGTNFARVSSASLTAGGLVIMSQVSGDADDISEGAANKFAGESGADVTANNPQAAGWLTDGGALATEDAADWATQVLGAGKPADNADVTSANPQDTSWLTGSLDDLPDDDGAIVWSNSSEVWSTSSEKWASQFRLARRSALTSSGLILQEKVVGTLDDVSDGGTYQRVRSASLTASGLVLLSAATGNLDDVGDGSTYARVNSTAITAGNILLSEAVGDLDDLQDGANFARVSSASLTAGGLVIMSQVDGNLDDIDDGGTYSKVLSTEVSAGHIVIEGPAGQVVIDQGTINADNFYTIDAEVTGTLSLGDNGQLVREEIIDEGGDLVTYAARFGAGGFDFGGRTGSGINKFEWHNLENPNYPTLDDNGNLTGEVYSYYSTSDGRNKMVIRSQSSSSNVADDSDILLTATRVMANADLEVNGYTSYSKQERNESGSGEIALNVNAGVVLLDAPNDPIICHVNLNNVEEIPGKVIDVVFINVGSSSFRFRDLTATSFTDANIKCDDRTYFIFPGTRKAGSYDVDTGILHLDVNAR